MRSPRTSIAPHVWSVALAASALFLGCGREAGHDVAQKPRAPVLLFAVDGLDWNVLLPLVQRGEAPHLAGLNHIGIKLRKNFRI